MLLTSESAAPALCQHHLQGHISNSTHPTHLQLHRGHFMNAEGLHTHACCFGAAGLHLVVMLWDQLQETAPQVCPLLLCQAPAHAGQPSTVGVNYHTNRDSCKHTARTFLQQGQMEHAGSHCVQQGVHTGWSGCISTHASTPACTPTPDHSVVSSAC
jgi:hypothetical protein